MNPIVVDEVDITWCREAVVSFADIPAPSATKETKSIHIRLPISYYVGGSFCVLVSK